jgi:hypothetical protein
MRTEELANYIEKLRYGRNISQEIFLEEIISLRQYQRYRSGQSIMPIEIAEKLAIRLSISIEKLLYEFEEDKNVESGLVKEYYNAVISNNFNRIKSIEKKFNDYVFIDDEKRIIYDSAKYLFDYNRSKLSKVELIKKQTELINYPKMLNNDVLTDPEILILGTILNYSETERDKIVEKLTAIFDKSNILVSGSNLYSYTQVIFWIAKHYGRVHKYDKVIKFSNLGIKYNIDNRTTYLLSNFYYFKALVYYRSNKFDDFEDNLYKCIVILEAEAIDEIKENFYKIIMKDLKLNPYEFLVRVAQKKIVQHSE